jgi:Flp pilus assembly protein TadD
MKPKHLWPLFGVLALSSCASQPAKTPKQKEAAQKQWNGARSGVLYGLARDQYQAGEFETSRQTIGEALKLSPDNATLHVLAGKIQIEQGAFEPAETSLKRAAELDANNAEAQYLLGVIYQRWQRYAEASAAYAAAVAKAPAELAYLLAESEMLVQLGREDEALTLLSNKVVYFENSAAIRDAVGLLLSRRNRHAEAVPYFRQASILAADDDTIREHLALSLYRSNDYREAASQLNRLTSSSAAKRSDLWLAQGEANLALERPIPARDAFDTVTRLDPTASAGWIGVAKASLKIGDTRRAEMSARRALSCDGNLGDGHLLLGYVRLRQSKPAEALLDFQKAAALMPADPLPLCMVGYVLEKQGRHDEAMTFYAKAIRLSPADPLARQLITATDLRD